MVDKDMMAYLDGVSHAETYSEIKTLLFAELAKLGALRFFHVFVPPYSFFDSDQIAFFQKGYENIPGFIRDLEAYLKTEEANTYFNFHRNRETRAYLVYPYKESAFSKKNLRKLLSQYKNYLSKSVSVSVPVFGPNGHYGFYYVPFEQSEITKTDLRMAEFLCQNAHHRYVELTLYPEQPIKLSPREKDVLTMLVRGKNNSAMATELDISRHTVDEYIRRIFVKLEVHDRVSASIKAMQLFLFQDETDKVDPEQKRSSFAEVMK